MTRHNARSDCFFIDQRTSDAARFPLEYSRQRIGVFRDVVLASRRGRDPLQRLVPDGPMCSHGDSRNLHLQLTEEP